MKGVTLTVEATERLNGKIRVDLGESPTPVKGVARVLILEALERNGMLLEEMKEWRFLSEAKAVTLEGRLTAKGLRTLTDLIPFPVATVDLKGAQSKEPSPTPANSALDPGFQGRGLQAVFPAHQPAPTRSRDRGQGSPEGEIRPEDAQRRGGWRSIACRC